MGVGTVAGGILVFRVRPRRPLRLVGVINLLFAAPLAVLAATRSVALIALGALLAGLAMMFGNTVWETTLQRHIPSESLSRVSSYDWFGSLVLDPVGLAIWGPIAAVIGIDASLWTACGLTVAGALALLALPEIRRLPAFPAAGPEREPRPDRGPRPDREPRPASQAPVRRA
jgi:predicted MFS family arabinose efflux permease